MNSQITTVDNQSGIRRFGHFLAVILVYVWISSIIGLVLFSSDSIRSCNPDAVSVFTNQRECRIPGHYPLGPRVP